MTLKFYVSSLLALLCSPLIALPDINTMTLEEKIGQMLMVHFHGEEANEEAKRLIQEVHVGAFIYYSWSNGLNGPIQVQKLSNGLQKLSKSTVQAIPLLIAIDQEGGVVTRLSSGFTIFPGNAALGQTKMPDLATLSAVAIGEELKAVGINMNLAPVVDVNSNLRNPIIGVRAFSDSPQEVTLYGRLSLQGYRQAGIIATLKHFPGHGDVTVDSHLDLPVVKKSIEELEKTELLPFRTLLSDTNAIMTAHILIPSLDPQNCATLSSAILETLLRKQWGYEGVILTDSLVMQGVLNGCSSIDEAAVRAIQAGNDILVLGGKALNNEGSKELKTDDIVRIHQKLVEAVRQGKISKERIDASLRRILKLKNDYQLFQKTLPDMRDIELHVNTLEHQQLAKRIAKGSVKIIKKGIIPSNLEQKNIAIIAPEISNKAIQNTSLLQLGKENRSFFFNSLNEEEMKSSQALCTWADLLIICTYNAWKNEKQRLLIEGIYSSGKPVVVIALRDPQDAEAVPQGCFVIGTFSPTINSIQAAVDLLVR